MSSLLKIYCETFHIDPLKAMNLLQDWNVVSDECVRVEDVAPCDEKTAIEFCKLNKDDIKFEREYTW